MDVTLGGGRPGSGDELAALRVPVERRLRECLRDHRLERGRDLRRRARQLRRGRVEMRVQDRHFRRPVERRCTAEAFVQDAGERVHVGSRVHGFPLDLLRGAVLDRPDEASGARRPVRREVLGDTEVGEIGAVVRRDEDVRRLHVPVNKPACMGGVERGADLPEDPERPTHGERPFFREDGLQVAPVDAGHRDVEQPVLLPRVVDGADAGMVESGRELRLPQEAGAEVGLAERRGQELERGRTAEADVLGQVHDARCPVSDRLDDPVAAELGPDATIWAHRHEF